MISCIGRPVVDVPSLVKSVEAATRESLTSRLASSRHPDADVPNLLAVLSLMQTKAVHPLRECGSLTAHAHFVFQIAISSETLYDLLERNDFKITVCCDVPGDNKLAVISGTVKQFKDTAIECCTPQQPKGLRELMSDLVRFFITEGLGDVFYDLNKKPSADGTLLLTRK